MSVAGDPGRDPDQDVLAAGGQERVSGEPGQAVELIERVQHDVADAGGQRLAQLHLGLGVAVHVRPTGVEAGTERQRELAAGRHVAGQSLLCQHAVDGRAGECLGREQHVEVPVASRERVGQLACPAAQVVLHHDVGGCAELARQLQRVAAAHLQPAALVDAAAAGEDV